MFDFFDIGVMEKLQWGLVCVNKVTVGSFLSDDEDSSPAGVKITAQENVVSTKDTISPEDDQMCIESSTAFQRTDCTSGRATRRCLSSSNTRSSQRLAEGRHSDESKSDDKYFTECAASKNRRTRSSATATDHTETRSRSATSSSDVCDNTHASVLPSPPVTRSGTAQERNYAVEGDGTTSKDACKNSAAGNKNRDGKKKLQYPSDKCGAAYQQDSITVYPSVSDFFLV